MYIRGFCMNRRTFESIVPLWPVSSPFYIHNHNPNGHNILGHRGVSILRIPFVRLVSKLTESVSLGFRLNTWGHEKKVVVSFQEAIVHSFALKFFFFEEDDISSCLPGA